MSDVDTNGKRLNLFPTKKKKRQVSNNQAFDMMTAVADKTAVDFSQDERNMNRVSQMQIVTDDDRETWKNFSERLGSLAEPQKQQLKNLWIESGRPIINILKKDTPGHKGEKNRAWFNAVNIKKGSNSKLHRDEMNIYEQFLVKDFMAEYGHSKKFSQKVNEDVGDWQIRRADLSKRVSDEASDFGEDAYGGTRWRGSASARTPEKWFPYQKLSPTYHIGKVDGEEIAMDEEGNVYPHVELPKRQDFDGGSSRTTKWQNQSTRRAVFDPETRLGEDGQKLPHEFEVHRVVEDSLWGDYESRFGSDFGENSIGWWHSSWREKQKKTGLPKKFLEKVLR